jgi:CSLREA domain-containing protein
MKRVSGGPRSAIAGTLVTVVVALLSAALVPVASAATITPTVTTDDRTVNGNCTLREAILAASGNAADDQCAAGSATSPDVIVLLAPLYQLTLAGANEDSDSTGDLDVFLTPGGPLTIEGKSGAGSSVIDGTSGANTDRVIDVITTTASSLTLANVTLNDGHPPLGTGGALRVPGLNSVTLDSSSVTNSSSTSAGGGIQVAGDLTLNGSTVSGNASTAATGVVGAGISSGGDLVIDGSAVSGNHVDAPDDANSDDLRGGGIVAQAGSISILNSTVSGNSVHALDPSDTAGGGGIFAASVPVTITNSTVSGNSVDQVGSLSVAGGLFFIDIGPTKHFLKVQNSTFSGNSAQSTGGAMQIFDGLSGVLSTTFSGNTSGTGKAIEYDDFADVISSVQIGNSILSDGGTSECGGPDALTTNASFGFNIDRGTSCALTGNGNLQNTNPNLLGLANNGGPTRTHALPAGSPALDRIPAASCTQIDTTPLTIDQRGTPRGFDEDGDGIPECDVGAYELNRCQGAIVNALGGTSAADVIVGTSGSDVIDPREGNDKICAGDGDDQVIERPSGGTDSIDGEGASDTVALGNGAASPAGTIDLLAGTGSIPSGTGTTFALDSIENAQGSVQTDTLIGDGGPNQLDGGIGDDIVTGGGGADELLGGNDSDQIFARDGIADTVDCGTGTDNAQTDRLSVDSVTGCETLDALAEPVVRPPSQTPAKKKCKKRKRGKRATAAKKCKKKKRR